MWLAEMVMGAAGGTMPIPFLAVVAAAQASNEVPASTIVAGLIALASAAIAAWIGSRGTLRTASNQREVEFDKRVDARLVRLEDMRQQAEERAEHLYAEMHRYREMYGQLRLDVMAAGLDPDNLGGRSTGEAPK